MGRLKGKGALVTGSSRGIGAAIARQLAHEGARVIVNFRSSRLKAEQLVADIVAQGGWAEALQADIADMQQVEALMNDASARLAALGGRLNVLVCNAGTVEPARLEEIDEAQFDRQFGSNVKSVLFSAQAVAHIFGEQGGAIINISSINARIPSPGYSVYSSTKAAVEAITIALARELGHVLIKWPAF